MKKCQYCAEEIMDDAVVCKHCKKSLNNPSKSYILVTFPVIIITLIALSIYYFTNYPDGGIEKCNNEITGILKSPGTATFGEPQIIHDEYGDTGGYYTIKNHVDSQNGFGALLRTNFECLVIKSENKPIINIEGDLNYTSANIDLKKAELLNKSLGK